MLIQPGERDGENRWDLAVGRTRQEDQGPDLLLWLKVSLRRSEAGILVREGGKETVKGKEAEERRQAQAVEQLIATAPRCPRVPEAAVDWAPQGT